MIEILFLNHLAEVYRILIILTTEMKSKELTLYDARRQLFLERCGSCLHCDLLLALQHLALA